MNWFGQLTKLILDYYREDAAQWQQLQELRRCRVSRRWGTLRIDCRDRPTAEQLAAAGLLLREPVAALRLAHHINILVRGRLIASVPVDGVKQPSWEIHQ
ncbi:MAG: hypothetical protein KME20_25870 [Kaiparowitsia implicata GSE-PSE-MK54-09C]|jgi:hypothetical protein|nr:hypothetical protein [Kaiparowitsia implicata GSE-PSE-MK54-09C]